MKTKKSLKRKASKRKAPKFTEAQLRSMSKKEAQKTADFVEWFNKGVKKYKRTFDVGGMTIDPATGRPAWQMKVVRYNGQATDV